MSIRESLEELEFNWDNGRILLQTVYDYMGEPSKNPGWESFNNREGSKDTSEYIDFDHPVLDADYDVGYGGPECPRFIAEDDQALYFPAQYDGSTWIEVVYKNIDVYLEKSTPYPGG
jgi:hypothetical protein